MNSYIDDLAYHLRLLDVPGERIGQILTEVQSHLTDSGEDPVEAFGTAKDYAQAVAGRRKGRSTLSLVGIGALSFALGAGGGALLVNGVISLFSGDSSILGLPPILLILAGAALIAGCYAYVRWLSDPITDPVTGRPVEFGKEGMILAPGSRQEPPGLSSQA